MPHPITGRSDVRGDEDGDLSIMCPHCNGLGRLSMAGATLAERVRFCRAAAGKSLRQIPGISSALLSQIETGRITNPGAEKLCAMADAFGVSIDWLLGRKAPR